MKKIGYFKYDDGAMLLSTVIGCFHFLPRRLANGSIGWPKFNRQRSTFSANYTLISLGQYEYFKEEPPLMDSISDNELTYVKVYK
jgi:hypothetical protein